MGGNREKGERSLLLQVNVVVTISTISVVTLFIKFSKIRNSGVKSAGQQNSTDMERRCYCSSDLVNKATQHHK